MDKRKISFILLGIVILFVFPSFISHVGWFITGHVESLVIQNRWDLVLINIFIFLAFLLPLNFRKKINWKSMSIYSAFIISLFVEMYGIPLTIYMTSTVTLPAGTPPTQEVIITLTFFGQTLSMTFWKIVGALISITGMVVVAVGWITLYRYSEENKIVTSGIYNYSRHPQYLGLILIVLGWFIHWPSILTLSMLPILVYFYYNLTIKEEEELLNELENTDEYLKYLEDRPRFI